MILFIYEYIMYLLALTYRGELDVLAAAGT